MQPPTLQTGDLLILILMKKVAETILTIKMLTSCKKIIIEKLNIQMSVLNM